MQLEKHLNQDKAFFVKETDFLGPLKLRKTSSLYQYQQRQGNQKLSQRALKIHELIQEEQYQDSYIKFKMSNKKSSIISLNKSIQKRSKSISIIQKNKQSSFLIIGQSLSIRSRGKQISLKRSLSIAKNNYQQKINQLIQYPHISLQQVQKIHSDISQEDFKLKNQNSQHQQLISQQQENKFVKISQPNIKIEKKRITSKKLRRNKFVSSRTRCNRLKQQIKEQINEQLKIIEQLKIKCRQKILTIKELNKLNNKKYQQQIRIEECIKKINESFLNLSTQIKIIKVQYFTYQQKQFLQKSKQLQQHIKKIKIIQQNINQNIQQLKYHIEIIQINIQNINNQYHLIKNNIQKQYIQKYLTYIKRQSYQQSNLNYQVYIKLLLQKKKIEKLNDQYKFFILQLWNRIKYDQSFQFKIHKILKLIQLEIQIQERKIHKISRLEDTIIFRPQNKIINFINVNGVQLFYSPQDKEQKVITLFEQYKVMKNGKKLINKVSIDGIELQIPLDITFIELYKIIRSRKNLQIILNLFQTFSQQDEHNFYNPQSLQNQQQMKNQLKMKQENTTPQNSLFIKILESVKKNNIPSQINTSSSITQHYYSQPINFNRSINTNRQKISQYIKQGTPLNNQNDKNYGNQIQIKGIKRQNQKRKKLYKCKIKIINLPIRQKIINYDISQNTKFYQLFGHIQIKYGCVLSKQFIQILFQPQKIQVKQNCWNQKIIQYVNIIANHKIQSQNNPIQFSINYLIKKCFFRMNSSYLKVIRSNENNVFQNKNKNNSLTNQNLEQVYNQFEEQKNQSQEKIHNKIHLLSYNINKKSFQQAQLNHLDKINDVTKYLRIQFKQLSPYYKFQSVYSQQSQNQILQCSHSVLLMNQSYDWILSSQLKIGNKIRIYNKTQKISLAQITKIDQIQIPQTIHKFQIILQQQNQNYQFLTISSNKYQNIIINNVIVHNYNTHKIQVCQILGKDKVQKFKTSVCLTNTLKHYFKNKLCFLGGILLDNNSTFGDYQIYKFKTLYIAQKQEDYRQYNEFCVCQYQGEHIVFSSIEQDKLRQSKNKWKQNYMGIFKKSIVLGKQIQNYQDNLQFTNILVDNNNKFQRQYYFNYVRNKYPDNFQQLFQSYINQLDQIISVQNFSNCQASVIYLYTLQSKRFYSEINSYLRETYVFHDDILNQKKYIPQIKWLHSSIDKIPSSNGKFYRGVKSIDIQKELGLFQNQTFIITQFLSVSSEQSVARRFTESGSILYILYLKNAKSIEKFSKYPRQKEYLVAPFTCFQFLKHDSTCDPQIIQLEQIELPYTNFTKTLFWIDDNPQNNKKLIQNYLKNKQIQVIPVVSTKMMQLIVNNYFWIYKLLGKKIAIISDMVRKQYSQNGYQIDHYAGVNIFDKLSEIGISNKYIIYSSDKKKALENIRQIYSRQVDWTICTTKKQILKQIYNYFQILEENEENGNNQEANGGILDQLIKWFNQNIPKIF